MLCFTQIGKQEMQIALHNLYHKYYDICSLSTAVAVVSRCLEAWVKRYELISLKFEEYFIR